MLRPVEFALGLLLTIVALSDVFSTILVPGPSRGRLRIAAWISRVILPVARGFSRGPGSPGSRPGNSFAPILFILAAIVWLMLLLFGYGLMFHALAREFSPPLARFDEALYIAGSSLLTLGAYDVAPHWAARFLILCAALSGFAVITSAISFIMQIQSGLHKREPLVLTLSEAAGRPPSGIALLETYAALGMRRELSPLFSQWREWSADVLHSHVSYPVLAYFHSADAQGDWLAALEAVLDAATMLMAFTDDETSGAATLMHRSGSRAASQICQAFQLHPADPEGDDPAACAELCGRLAAAGFSLKEDKAQGVARLSALRQDYAPRIKALSKHLGADRTRLLPFRRHKRSGSDGSAP